MSWQAIKASISAEGFQVFLQGSKKRVTTSTRQKLQLECSFPTEKLEMIKKFQQNEVWDHQG